MTNRKSNIFCPNCSANNKIEQNFCRFCGLNLLETTKSLRTQFSTDVKEQRFKRLELIKKLSDSLLVTLALTAAIGMLIYSYSDSSQAFFFGRKSFVFTLIVVFLTVQSALSYFRRKNTTGYWEELAAKKAASPGELKARETAKLLEDKPFEPAASVTENSTRLLFVENKTNKLG